MKLYKTTSCATGFHSCEYREFSSSAGAASKARTRLKKLDHVQIVTVEVEVGVTRDALIPFLNELMAHESWVVPVVAAKLKA